MSQADLPETMLTTLFRGVADLSFDAITVTRASESSGPEIVYVNDAFTQLTGYPTGEVIGETPGILQGPHTDSDVLKRLDEMVARGEPFHGQTINYRKDGSPFEMEWKVMRLGEADGATYYVAVQREAEAR